MSTLLHKNASVLCPHGGSAQFFVKRPRVLLSRHPALTAQDPCTVSGCSFQIANMPRPCVRIRFLQAARRVRSGGQALVLRDSGNACLSAEEIPQGQAQVLTSQSRVRGK